MTEILSSSAEISHINLRKQGLDDNRVLAVDIKFSGARSGPDILKQLLGLDNLDEIKEAFWNKDGISRFPGIDSITPMNIIENCTVKFGDVNLENCDARKFHIKPCAGYMVAIDFTASAVRPPAPAMQRIPNLINEEVRVSVTIKQLSLLDQAKQEPENIAPYPLVHWKNKA